MSEAFILGVDIGGTKVAAGLVNTRGEIVYKTRTPMLATGNAAAGLQSVRAAIDTAIRENAGANVAAIGLISPGPLDPKTGVVINPPNLPCWRNTPVAAEIRQAYGLPARLDNDANAAALAEALWGAGQGYTNVFYATIGTGIGSGIVFATKLYHGRTGAAAEAGHMTIDYRGPRCGCGKFGCIEILASGPAIARRAQAKLADDPARASRMFELAGSDTSKVTGEIVGKAWAEGDSLAGEVLRETADLLAIWLGNVVDVLEPDVLVVGGGVAELLSGWFDHIRLEMQKWSINQRCGEIPLVLAQYKADAGVAGAAALMLDEVTLR